MAGQLKGLTVQINGDTTDLGKELDKIKDKVKGTSGELKQIDKLLKLDPKNTELLAQKQSVLSEKIAATKERLLLLKDAQESAAQAFKDKKISEEAYRELQRESIRAAQELEKLEQQSKETADALNDSGKKGADGAKKISKGEKEVGDEADKSGGKVSRFGDILKGTLAAKAITSGLSAIKKTFAGFFSSSASEAQTFESAFAKTKTIMDVNEVSVADMETAILNLSKSSGMAAADVSEAVYQAISGSVSTSDAVSFVDKANKLAVAGFTDLSKATDVLTTTLNAYGMSADSVEGISNVLIKTQNLGKTSVDELSSNMGKAIATGSAYGVNLENISTAYVELTKGGIATSESTTYIASMLKELGKEGSTVADILKAKTGRSFGEFMASGASLGDVMQILNDYVDGNAEALMNLWGSQEAGKAANAIMTQSVEDFNSVCAQMSKEMHGASDTAAKAYDTMADTSEMTAKRADAALDGLKIVTGDAINEIKTNVLGGMIPALQKGSDAIKVKLADPKTKKDLEKTGKAVGDIAAKSIDLATKVLPVLANGLAFVSKHGIEAAAVAGGLVLAIKGFSIASAAKKAIDGATTAIKGMNAAMASNPIGAVITVIGILIAALSALCAASNKAIDEQRELAESFSDAADAAMAAQKARWDAARKLDDEFSHYRDLVGELDNLVDADGRVLDGNIDRANYIKNELSAATGIEIELIDGAISKYDELSESISDVLLKKQADAYLSSVQSAYDTAASAVNSTETDESGNYVAGSQAAVEQSRSRYQSFKREYDDIKVQWDALEMQYQKGLINDAQYFEQHRIIEVTEDEFLRSYGLSSFGKAKTYLELLEQTYHGSLTAYDENVALISEYEAVQAAVFAEDMPAIADAMNTAAEGLMLAGTASLYSLEKQRDAAVKEYNDFLAWSKEAGSSVTAEQVSQRADKALAAAIEAHKQIIIEADGRNTESVNASRENLVALVKELTGATEIEIGEMLSDIEDKAAAAGDHYVEGIEKGIDENRGKAEAAAKRLADSVNRSFQSTLEINSPSKVGERSAKWYPIGVAQGIDAAADIPINSAIRMAAQLNSALSGGLSPETLDFGAFGGNFTRYERNYFAGAPVDLTGIMDRLERILSGINAIDPAVYVDGERLSNKLLAHTDRSLGRLAGEVARGRM